MGKLSIGVNFIVPTIGPSNSVQLTIGINETGGLAPFNFTAYWSDDVNQTNNVGVFIRSFFSNQSIPSSLKVVVQSSDGQTATISVQIPSVNRTISTTSTTTSSITTIPTIIFVESGLPSGSLWTLTISGNEFHSNTSQIIFNYPAGNAFSYVVSGPYDSKNFAWAYIPSPQSGTLIVNKSDIRASVTFSNKTVFTPSNSLFIMMNPQCLLHRCR